MKTRLPQWALALKTRVPNWLGGLMTPGAPFGRFRFAAEGAVHLPYDIISVHFAAAIYEHLGIEESLTTAQKQQWMMLSCSWRDPKTGEVRDPNGIEKGVPDNDDLSYSVTALRRNMNRCCAGVFGAGNDVPLLQQEVKAFADVDKMKAAFDDEAWGTNSWGAGAHCAHYLNAMLQWRKAGHDEFDHAINEAVKYLYARQHRDDGTFGGRGQDANQLIGGILKVYTRLFGTMGLAIQYPEQVIDTAIDLLRSGELKGNCPAHNALIVLLMCRHFTDYRLEEIQEEAHLSLERDIYPLFNRDGAFGSGVATSQYAVWGVKMVEDGYSRSNIHSTLVMLQAVRVVAELLDLENELKYSPSGWKRSRARKK